MLFYLFHPLFYFVHVTYEMHLNEMANNSNSKSKLGCDQKDYILVCLLFKIHVGYIFYKIELFVESYVLDHFLKHV